MNGKVTQEEINKVVWQACDTFRGVIDPSQYKDYILTMLFLKYVSDVSKAKYKEYLQRYDGDTERAQRAMRRERFQVPEKSSFDYLFEHRNEPNIGELIDIALADLEFANREKLSSEDGSGIFRNISFNSSNLGETAAYRLLGRAAAVRRVAPREQRRHRRCLYVPYREVRQRCREEGWRVLHTEGGFNLAGTANQERPRLTHLRPDMRLGFTAHQGRPRGRLRQLLALWSGAQRQHLGAGHDEHAAPRLRQRHHPLG